MLRSSMVGDVISSIEEWMASTEDDYEVEEYVLTRREPDPENRVRVYDSPADSDEVEANGSLPPGTYILQEVKPSGMAGQVVWEEEIDPR